MTQTIQVIVYPVKDLASAKTFYTKFLEVEPYVDSPYYVGYKTGNLEVGLDPNSTTGPIAYIDVEDIASSLQDLVNAGGETLQEPKDVGGGMKIATIKDKDSNIVGLRQQP